MTTRKTERLVDVRRSIGVPRLIAVWCAVIVALSCSGDAKDTETIGEIHQALTTNESILGFEGPVGGATPEWSPASGTTGSSSNIAFSGAHALSLSGNA